MTPAELSIIFFLELFVIVVTARVVGWLGTHFLGQPQVVGEMIAGVVLGPSFLGLLFPDLQAALFPNDARGVLYVGAQLGVGLYMFLVGLGFDKEHLRLNVGSAGAISLSGMAAPFLAAAIIAPWLMGIPGLFAPTMTQIETTLFLGACIAITAFPMLARIIHERGISGTPLGSLALSAGAIDDAGAWIALAIVLATFGGGTIVAVKTIAGAVVFATFMLTLAPRLLAPLGEIVARDRELTPSLLAVVLMLFLFSAFAMDWVGMHAVFGGFLLGIAMPRGAIVEELRTRLEPFTVVLLLPMFFTFSGLNSQLALVTEPSMFGIAMLILVVSILAKLGACWAAARLTGQDNPTALAIGALMNARGLMELILINIGLQRGLIGPGLFSIMVMVAIVTTLMASPLFELVYRRRRAA